MRLPPVLDPNEFSPAELSALRLDGDCFSLGDATVAVDQPVDPATRAAALGATVHAGIVAERSTAAWVHGATWVLRRPLRFSIDRSTGRRAAPAGAALREVWFDPHDLQRVGGIVATTRLRTAIDLARLEPAGAGVDQMIRTLLRGAGLDGPRAAAALHERGTMPHKRRGMDRLNRLHPDGVDDPTDEQCFDPRPVSERADL